jgi:hypothetical protein
MIGELSETRRRRGSAQLVGADTALLFQRLSQQTMPVIPKAWRVYVRGVAF